MTYKIAYDAGHGMNTAGKRTPDGEREWSFNDKVVKAFEAEMRNYEGVSLKRLDDPSGKTDVSLTKRTNDANAWGANIFVSFHHNAITGVWGTHTGTETFYHRGSSQGGRLAGLVQAANVKAYGIRDRGLKTSNLHITRETNMPAVLIEGGFMDSSVDIVKMRDDSVLAEAGRLTAQAVAEYAGLKRKDVTKTTPAPKSEVKSVKTTAKAKKSIAQMADEVVANKHGNGHENRRKSLGISESEYAKVRAEVNRRAGASTPKSSAKPRKTVAQMAKEVIDGKHGNGHDSRRKSLGISSAEYDKVRAEVNRQSSGGITAPTKSVNRMANEVIAGRHGSGHVNRRRSLGISQALYEKVRAEVNRRL